MIVLHLNDKMGVLLRAPVAFLVLYSGVPLVC